MGPLEKLQNPGAMSAAEYEEEQAKVDREIAQYMADYRLQEKIKEARKENASRPRSQRQQDSKPAKSSISVRVTKAKSTTMTNASSKARNEIGDQNLVERRGSSTETRTNRGGSSKGKPFDALSIRKKDKKFDDNPELFDTQNGANSCTKMRGTAGLTLPGGTCMAAPNELKLSPKHDKLSPLNRKSARDERRVKAAEKREENLAKGENPVKNKKVRRLVVRTRVQPKISKPELAISDADDEGGCNRFSKKNRAAKAARSTPMEVDMPAPEADARVDSLADSLGDMKIQKASKTNYKL
jgi:hypothetical protein